MRPSYVLAICCVALLSQQLLFAGFRDATNELGFSGGGKASFVDFDGDGWVDIFVGRLYRNEEGKKLVAVENSGLPGGDAIWGDFDNDGDPDAFFYGGAGALWRNKGDRTFEKVETPALPTQNSRGAVWIDINNDARLDLFVGGYEIWQQRVHPDAILIAKEDGSFAEHWRSAANACYSARGVTAADFDADGDPDVYVSNYRLQPNHLWRNDGKGKFVDVAAEFGAAGKPDSVITYTGGIRYGISGHTIGSAFGDLDDDGYLDLFVGNFSHPRPGQDHPEFLRNRGPDGQFKFEDRSKGAGLGWQESYASPTLGDYDNDGDLDLYFTTVYAVGSGNIRNYPVLYRNQGNWKFENVTDGQGLGKLGATYQAAWGDIDNDGDLDLCTAGKIFVNELPASRWLELVLEGDGRAVNRTGIGAVVRVRIGDRVLTRHLESGTGEGNQNDLRLHFGLAKHEAPVKVEITWPGKRVQVVEGVDTNRVHTIRFKP